MKQTAVEWLVNVVQSCIAPDYIPTKIIEQAKEMEKEQIMDAYDRGYNEYDIYRNGKNYYIETYEQSKQG